MPGPAPLVSKTYAAPCWLLLPTVAYGALETTVVPETPTEAACWTLPSAAPPTFVETLVDAHADPGRVKT